MSLNLAERPVFVIGSERSDTTLVMAILGCHPRLAVPEVAWYYPRFRPYLFTYGPLGEAANSATLCHEMAYGLRTPFWGMEVDADRFGDEMTARAGDRTKLRRRRRRHVRALCRGSGQAALGREDAL